MYLLRGYLSYLNIKMLALDHMEKEIPLATEKKKNYWGTIYNMVIIFLDFQTTFLSISFPAYFHISISIACVLHMRIYTKFNKLLKYFHHLFIKPTCLWGENGFTRFLAKCIAPQSAQFRFICAHD